jgi:DNA-binding NarL/FixJ family response regulator
MDATLGGWEVEMPDGRPTPHGDGAPAPGQRILLADDHAVVREALRLLIESRGFEVVGEAVDGLQAIALARRVRPDIAVLDLAMPLANGIEAARETQAACPGTATVLLIGSATDAQVLDALRAGVRACVLKSYEAEDLIRALREVARGEVHLSRGLTRAVVEAWLGRNELPADPLTPRERQVLQIIAEGRTTKEVAQLLCVSVKTVESHRARIMAKLSIHQTAGLVRYAIRRGLSQL